jgi:hypothetical protein
MRASPVRDWRACWSLTVEFHHLRGIHSDHGPQIRQPLYAALIHLQPKTSIRFWNFSFCLYGIHGGRLIGLVKKRGPVFATSAVKAVAIHLPSTAIYLHNLTLHRV